MDLNFMKCIAFVNFWLFRFGLSLIKYMVKRIQLFFSLVFSAYFTRTPTTKNKHGEPDFSWIINELLDCMSNLTFRNCDRRKFHFLWKRSSHSLHNQEVQYWVQSNIHWLFHFFYSFQNGILWKSQLSYCSDKEAALVCFSWCSV